MAGLKDLKDQDLYRLFEVKENATNNEIKKAYRKKALQLHPDKNPNDPKAAELFHELSEALKVLTDVGARAAYDHVRNARKAAAARTAQLDERRKKIKLDLEAREKLVGMKESDSTKKAERTLKQEIQRLREEGSRILQEEQLAMKKLLKKKVEERLHNILVEPARLKVKWKTKGRETNLYVESSLRQIFSKHGDVVALIISSKNNSAIVEFKTSKEAQSVHDSEIGFPENPLHISWLSGQNLESNMYTPNVGVEKDSTASREYSQCTGAIPTVSDDFESQVFEKMRRMQEMKMNQRQGDGCSEEC